MKYALLILTVLIGSHAHAQIKSVADTSAAPSEFLASTGGIGPFKLGMGKETIEKLAGTKIRMLKKHNPDKGDYGEDTSMLVYKDAQIFMVLSNGVYDDHYAQDTVQKLRLYSIWTQAAAYKTRSGIRIGDDKLKIVSTYEKYRLEIAPDWDQKNNPTKSSITLYDNELGRILVFHMDNNLVTGFEASYFEGD